MNLFICSGVNTFKSSTSSMSTCSADLGGFSGAKWRSVFNAFSATARKPLSPGPSTSRVTVLMTWPSLYSSVVVRLGFLERSQPSIASWKTVAHCVIVTTSCCRAAALARRLRSARRFWPTHRGSSFSAAAISWVVSPSSHKRSMSLRRWVRLYRYQVFLWSWFRSCFAGFKGFLGIVSRWKQVGRRLDVR